MLDAIESVGGKILDGLHSVLQLILNNTTYRFLYYIDAALCKIIGLLYKVFGIFTGTQPVYVKDGNWVGETDLFSVLLGNRSITTVYWCMAMVGVALCIGFTIIAVIRKMADLSGKQQRSYGQILLGTGKSILIMLLMTLILSVSMSATTALTDAVNVAFNAGSTSTTASAIDFTGEEYAAMARVLNTVGNYSLNTATTSRYNINACFNDIRPDLQWLQEQGVFDFYYAEKDPDGNSIVSWQSELQKIVNAADLRYDLTMDAYNESVAVAIREVMATLKNNGAFRPLAHYENRYDIGTLDNTPLDTILFLMATNSAAKNENYNINPSIMDNLRGAYYSGEKSIYDEKTVVGDFDIAVGSFDHIIIYFGALFLIPNLTVCVFNAIARMFNILMLFLMAPLALSTMPNDDGAKFKQWTTAFVIQCFSILGIIVSMRLLMLIMPIVYSGNVEFFRNNSVFSVLLDTIAKLLLLIGGTEACKKASGIITGILADNAGFQSITAGDMSGFAGSVMGGVAAVAGGVAGVAADVSGISGVAERVGQGWKSMASRGGVLGTAANIASGGRVGQNAEERSAERQHDFQKKMDKWDKKDADGAAGAGGASVANTPSQPGNNNAATPAPASNANQGNTQGGNKPVPPTNSDEFNAQLNQEGSPDNQQNLNANSNTPSDSQEFNTQLQNENELQSEDELRQQQNNLSYDEPYSSVEPIEAPPTNFTMDLNQPDELDEFGNTVPSTQPVQQVNMNEEPTTAPQPQPVNNAEPTTPPQEQPNLNAEPTAPAQDINGPYQQPEPQQINKTPPPVDQTEFQQSYGGEPIQAKNYSAPDDGDE